MSTQSPKIVYVISADERMTTVKPVDAASTLFLACPAQESGESVDVSTEPFGPWVQPMIDAGAVDPRRDEPIPSWNRLAELAHLSTSTVTGMVDGTRSTSTLSVQKVAKVLKVDPREVSKWLDLSRPVGRRYVAPPEADLLTERQQKALTTFIRALAADQKEGTSHGDSDTQKSVNLVRDPQAKPNPTTRPRKPRGKPGQGQS